jgi:hypothetical protein
LVKVWVMTLDGTEVTTDAALAATDAAEDRLCGPE